MARQVKFIEQKQSAFFETTRHRVEAYFREKGISKNANGQMWMKTVFFLGGFLFLYVLIVSNFFNEWIMLVLASIFGMFSAFVGFNISHDAIHGSFSSSKTVNKLLSHTFYMIGANPYVWSISHNVVHHTYTNIPHHDEDLMMGPGIVRFDPTQEVNSLQRFQHLYAFWLYGLSSISWVFIKDYVRFFQKKIGQQVTQQHPRIEYFNLFFFKALYYFLLIILPLALIDITWKQFLVGFLVMHLSKGWVLGLAFQVGHIVEGTQFPTVNAEGNVEEAWAVHQMQTTANFSRKSVLASFFYGGMNTQIEHHLFPNICHIHYSAISDIVKFTAQEYNVPYVENRTFFSALQSHYKMLKKLGKDAYQEKIRAREFYQSQEAYIS